MRHHGHPNDDSCLLNAFIMCDLFPFSLMQAIKPLPKSALNEDGSFRVPDNLIAQPTDSEQDKEKKKRKIKVMDYMC